MKSGFRFFAAFVALAVIFTGITVPEPGYAKTYNAGSEAFSKQLSKMIKKSPAKRSSTIANSENSEFSSGRLIVKIKGKKKFSFAEYDPLKVLRTKDNIYIVQFNDAESAEKACKALKKAKKTEWVEADELVKVSETFGNDGFEASGYGSLSWGVDEIEADTYAAATGSGSITVAVIDTGVSSHSFLNGRLSSGYDFVNSDKDPSDEHYHGTHVAGTIVDCTPGLNVMIMPVRVLGADGNGYSSVIASGIRYAADNGALVINLSLGGGHSDYIDSSVQYAVSKGVTVVCAAGNDGISTEYFCPAHITDAIVVAAIDSQENRAYFSNFGTSVDVAAPGVDITSCIPGGSYSSMSGTSMASPHIAAAAAMIKLNNPDATPKTIESMLRSCCSDLGPSGFDTYYGYGVPRLSKLIGASVTSEPQPVTPEPEPVAPTPVQPEPVTPTPTPTPVYPDPVFPDPDPYPVVPAPDATSYKYVISYGGAVITGYDGDGGDITIPTELGGYTVTLIAAKAFEGNSNIRSVSIVGSVLVGERAFAGCTALETVNVSGIVSGIGSNAFSNCTKLKELNVSGMVFATQYDAFSGCNSLSDAYIIGMVDTSVAEALSSCPGNPVVHNSGLNAYTMWPISYPDYYYADNI